MLSSGEEGNGVRGFVLSGVQGKSFSDVQRRAKLVHFYLIICKLFTDYHRSTALVGILE